MVPVFQTYSLYPWKTVRENVAFGLECAKVPRAERADRIDELLGALDAQTRLAMQGFALEVWQRTGATVLMVTHDVDEAVYLGQRVVVLSSHSGRVVTEMAVPLGHVRGPDVKREPRFADLRDEIQDLLLGAVATPEPQPAAT
jgi:NitT/TauT family transport system ATP-binding protein